jgi:hypothetical protein
MVCTDMAAMAAMAHQHTVLAMAVAEAALRITRTVLNTAALAGLVAVATAVKATYSVQHLATQTLAEAEAVAILPHQRLAVAATLHLHITDHKDCHGAFCKSK